MAVAPGVAPHCQSPSPSVILPIGASPRPEGAGSEGQLYGNPIRAGYGRLPRLRNVVNRADEVLVNPEEIRVGVWWALEFRARNPLQVSSIEVAYK